MFNLEISVISTKKDMDLLFNQQYYNKVKKTLDNIHKEHKLTDKHCIACLENFIKLYNGNELVLIREF